MLIIIGWEIRYIPVLGTAITPPLAGSAAMAAAKAVSFCAAVLPGDAPKSVTLIKVFSVPFALCATLKKSFRTAPQALLSLPTTGNRDISFSP